jgi:hypothetical protein
MSEVALTEAQIEGGAAPFLVVMLAIGAIVGLGVAIAAILR